MKKTVCLLFSFVFVFICCFWGNVLADELPFREDVVVTCRGRSVYAKVYLQDFTTTEKAMYAAAMQEQFPNAVLLRSATSAYNCHSYAWHSQSTSNIYWVPQPSYFLEDGTYIQNTWKVGDRIVYYNNGTPIHSGIITAKSSNSLSGITVTSKWGAAGLYRHAGNYCPYPNENGSYTVVVFRLCEHTSSHLTYETAAAGHRVTCDVCGLLGTKQHVLNAQNTCILCGGRGPNIDINNHFNEEAA